MPLAYAPAPPIWLTYGLRSWNPSSAAKNGTCVVPACVMSGPVPETAEFLMRSNCTSQPTSLTFTFTPVCCSNGFRMRCVSSTGCGPLFITHIVTVAPRMFLAGAAAGLDDFLSLPPQAATTSASATLATSNMKRRVLLRLVISSPPPLENVYGELNLGASLLEPLPGSTSYEPVRPCSPSV